MTAITYFIKGDNIVGYTVSGHSTENEEDTVGKTVCAAISSAAYMTANTLSEIIGAELFTDVKDGEMTVKVLSEIDESQAILKGFRLHMEELRKQYKTRIKVVSEV